MQPETGRRGSRSRKTLHRRRPLPITLDRESRTMHTTALRLNLEPPQNHPRLRIYEEHPCFAAEHAGGSYTPPPSRPKWLVILCLCAALLATLAVSAAGCLVTAPRPGLSPR